MRKVLSRLTRTSIASAVILSMLMGPAGAIDVSAADLEFN